MGAVVSSSHVVSAAPSSSGGGLLTLCPCPGVGPFPRGAVLQEQAAPAWVRHGVTSPASKPALTWPPLSTGPQVLAGACSSMGSPRGHSLLWSSTCSGVGSLPWRGQPASPWSSPQVQGNLCSEPGAPPPLLLHWPWCPQSCSSHIVSLLSPTAIAAA